MAYEQLYCAYRKLSVPGVTVDTVLNIPPRHPEARVYNCTTYDNPCTWGQFERDLKRHLAAHPMDNALWYPSGTTVQNT